MKLSSLCVCIPSVGSIKTEMVSCLIPSLFKTIMSAGCDLHLVFPTGCLLYENRNIAAQEALDLGASHLMFIDSDMSFLDDGILALASRGKQIIGANYNLRRLPLESTVKMADKDGKLYEFDEGDIPSEPFKVYSVATGFMLITTETFRRIEKPWFFYEYIEGKKDIGEDVYFCKKAREKGIDVWCDPTVKVGHIGDYTY